MPGKPKSALALEMILRPKEPLAAGGKSGKALNILLDFEKKRKEEEEEKRKEEGWGDLLNKPVTIADPAEEERYREAELTSQPLPPIDLPTEEDRESWADIEREQAAKAREAFGLVGSESRKKEEEEAEGNVKKSLLSLRPAPVAQVQIGEPELKRAELPWDNLQRAASGGWDATTAEQKREKMRAFTEALIQIQSDGVLRQVFEMKLDDASTADQLKIIRALHDSRLWAQDMDYGALTPKADRERMEKLPAEYHQGKVTPPKPPGFWENFLRMPTLEELEPANLWKGWENASEAILQDVAQAGKTVFTGDWELPGFGAGDYRGRFGSGAEAFAHEVAPEAIPEPDRSEFIKGVGELGRMAPTLQASYMLGPFAGPVMRTLGVPALAAPAALGTAGAASEFIKTADDPISSWTVLDNPYIKSIEQGVVWAALPAAHKWVSGKAGTYMANLLKRNPKLAKLSSKSKVKQGVIAEVAGAGSMLALLESNPENIIAYMRATPEERKNMVQRFYGRAFGFGIGGAVSGVARPGPRGRAEPGQRPMGKIKGAVEDHVRRAHNRRVVEIMDNGWLMGIVQKSFERHLKIPTEAVPKSEAIEIMLSRLEKAKSGKTEAVQKAISEMQEKVRAGEFRVPRPKPPEEGLRTPELKAEKLPPWEMTEAEFNKAEAEGMGVTWLNAWKTEDGRILTSASREHGDMVDPRTGEIIEGGERGWVWKGLPKEDTFIGTSDVGKAKGNFWLAYKAKAPKPLTPVEAVERPNLEGWAADLQRVKESKHGDFKLQRLWGEGKDWNALKDADGFVDVQSLVEGSPRILQENPYMNKVGVKFAEKPGEIRQLEGEPARAITLGDGEGVILINREFADGYKFNWDADTAATVRDMVAHELYHFKHDKLNVNEGYGTDPKVTEMMEREANEFQKSSKPSELRESVDAYEDYLLREELYEEAQKFDADLRAAEKAPKPPSKGYLKPPATAFDLMKQKAAAAEAGKKLGELREAREEAAPGVIEQLYLKAIESGDKVKAEKLLKVLKKEELTTATEEGGIEVRQEPTEGLTKPLLTDKQMIEAAKAEAAEIDAAAALKSDVKVEEAATESVMEGSLLTEYIKNEKIRKFHKTIQRHMKGADAAEKARWAENPDSAYDVVPTSSWRRTIEKMSMEEIEADLSKNKDAIPKLGPELIVKSMLENRKAQLLKKRWRESKDPADWAEYESLVQELANPRTFAGQYIQAQRHFNAGNPIIEADVIAAAILNHKGPKLSKAERAELVELIDKSMESKERADKAAEEYWKDESNANWDGAIDALNKSEVATMNQIEFIANKTPKAVVDMLVATLQGNFLTPTTLAVNVAGNVAPLGPRALARVPARGLDMVEQFFMRDRRIAERNMLIDQQKKNPSVKVAARIEKLDKMLSPMEQIRLKPIEGTKEKFIGGWEGTGLPRVFEAIKKTREEGGNVMELLENFREGKKSTLGMDSAGAIILGEKLNQAMLIEVGEMDMSSMTPTLDAATASKRLLNTIRRKMGREVKGAESIKAISDLYEATFGLSPTIFFRLLAGGDIPFRNAELRRLIVEQAEIRKWSKEKTGRALERPSLIFKPKEWSALQFRAAQATFQHENRGTRAMQRVNKFIRGNSLKGEAAYLALRDMTPYQKTLINVHAELLNFTPFGLADVIATAHKDGFMSREAKISAGKVITGTTVMLIAERYLNNDIMSADQDPGMSESGDQRADRYMTEETYHHGFVNWDAAMRNMKGEDTAWQPGDYIADARRMGPFGYLLLNGANYHRSLEMMPQEDRDKLSSSWKTLLKFTGESVQYSAKYAINQSFATGVRDKLRAVSRAMSADTGLDALKPIAGVLLRDAMTIPVPNTLGWYSKAGSPYKQTFRSDELSQALKDEWAKKTGAWDEDYPIIVDLWGTPLESMPRGTLYPKVDWPPGKFAKHKDTAEGRVSRLDRLMASSFNIFRFKKSGTIMDPYSAEVYRLWRKFPKGNVVPPMASPKITLDGVKYKLNRDQYAYYSVLVGTYRLDGSEELGYANRRVRGRLNGVRQLVNEGRVLPDGRHQAYMDIPDEEKVEEMRSIYNKARTQATKHFAMWTQGKDKLRPDSITRGFKINIDNLPLTDDQIVKDPSGRVD